MSTDDPVVKGAAAKGPVAADPAAEWCRRRSMGRSAADPTRCCAMAAAAWSSATPKRCVHHLCAGDLGERVLLSVEFISWTVHCLRNPKTAPIKKATMEAYERMAWALGSYMGKASTYLQIEAPPKRSGLPRPREPNLL